MDEGPHRVALVGGGWSGPIGHCRDFKWTRPVRTGSIEWESIESSAFVFSQTAALLVAQGMKLSQLLPPDVRFDLSSVGVEGPTGPFLLLKGTLSTPDSPPMRLKDMVLARLTRVPVGMSEADVLSDLLRSVQ